MASNVFVGSTNTVPAPSSAQQQEAASPHLNSLLSKLRPFQRKAVDFAVNGILLSDDDNCSNNGYAKSAFSAAKRYTNKSDAGPTSPAEGSVAGAGTGRILLGDEMGLGYVYLHIMCYTHHLQISDRNTTSNHALLLQIHNDADSKTLTSLAIMLSYQQTEFPLLILCPASLRYTWPAEIEKFCPWIPSTAIYCVKGKDDVGFAVKIQRWRERVYQQQQIHRQQMQKQQNGHMNNVSNQTTLQTGTTSIPPPFQIVIVTYSLLQERFQIANILKECNFQCIIADESHNLKQLSSQRCQLALPLLQNSKRLLLLSGTPALNRPVELWPQLHALDPKGKMFGKYGMRYNDYTKRYCNAKRTRFGWDVNGSSNADELHACLKTVMIRRLKSEVLHDLPSKQRAIVPVTIVDKDKDRECRDLVAQMKSARQAVSEIMDGVSDDMTNSAHFEARRLLNQAYQASGIAKAPASTEYIVDWLDGSDSSQKLLVFAHHKEVLDYIETTISAKYKGRMGMIRIDGSVPPADRALRVRKFQTNDSIRLAILSMTAAGVGLTLTAASSIIFTELHWVPGVLAQAEDRCHRIGQVNAVNIMYAICKDEDVSVDRSLWAMLGRKVGNLGRVVDGERGKGLNAVEKEVESSSKRNGSQSGVSAEEDLASFFAGESPAAGPKKMLKGPLVKGSIQSFFKKQLEKKSQPPITSSAKSTQKEEASKEAATISLLDDDDCDDTASKGSVLKSIASTLSFSCHVCTFENHKGGSSCSMCGTARESDHSQLRTNVNTTTKPSSQPYDHDPKVSSEKSEYDITGKKWACSACTFVNVALVLNKEMSCDVCKSKTKLDQHASEVEKICLLDDNATNNVVYSQTACAAPRAPRVSQSPDSSINSTIKCGGKSASGHDNEIIAIDDDEEDDSPKSPRSISTPPMEILCFSVSKNSGRIALHLASTGHPLHVNFDTTQVLKKECSDRMEETNLKRVASSKVPSQSNERLEFDDGKVRQVLSVLDVDALFPLPFSANLNVMVNELKSFVSFYLGLREIEKKAVKDSGLSITSQALNATANKLLISTVTGTTTERYTGGAKERAIENKKNNCATKSDEDVINGKACAWCAKTLVRGSNNIIEATYCSAQCADLGRVRRGGMYASTKIREQLFALERGVCCLCKLDAHALYCRVKTLQPAERLNALLAAKFTLPKSKSSQFLIDPIKEHDFWQADHIVAVAEGGGGCGLDNLRTLCTSCHIRETAKLRHRLKTAPSNDSSQFDIIAAFSKANSDKGKKKRRRAAD